MDWAKERKAFWVLVILVFLFYSLKLSVTPVHLNQDELGISLNAYSISKTGHDLSGRFLPFYIQNFKDFWVPPIVVYPLVLILKFLPLNEVTIRLGSVLMGVSTIVLLSLLAEKIFGFKKYLYLTFLIAAITPGLFINSRILVGNIYPVPFVCAWLYFLHKFIKSKSYKHIFLSCLFLGLGIHTYHAPKLMMPLYFSITLLIVFFNNRKKYVFVSSFLGFLAPIIVSLPWLFKHPETLFSQIKYAQSVDSSVGIVNRFTKILSVERYFSYFSPNILFIRGDSTFVHSTGKVGVFLFPISVLLIFGIVVALSKKDLFSKILLFGLITYPVAPAVIDDPGRISRGLIVIPFVILLSIYGFEFLVNQKDKKFKLVIFLIAIFFAIEFINFYRDYIGDFRARSEIAYHGDVGGAYESVLKSTQLRDVEKIYVDSNIDFAKPYFDFYQIKFARNVSFITKYIDLKENDFSKYDAKSIVLVKGDPESSRLGDHYGSFERVEVIREPSGSESFYVYYRD